ncbi:hypothetical protein MKEN_00026900 [Mycena kentingensis (nom. inval.)]|nr:hypothetical protein MKEN_00026900 [Mycena kentingensis (nom. inval.)]
MVRVLLPVFTSILVASVSAAPVPQPLDLGNIGQAIGGALEGVAAKAVGECNVNRFQIVTNLAATGALVKKVADGSSDPATAAAVKATQDGLRSSGEGIAQIALALITGGSPPAAARDQTQQGLLDAQTALTGITEAGVQDAVKKAADKLAESIVNGNDVVANCGGADPAAGDAAAEAPAADDAADADAEDDAAAADDAADDAADADAADAEDDAVAAEAEDDAAAVDEA